MNQPNPYQVLQTTEKTLFDLTPLPLQSVKTGIRQMAVPLLVTTAASHLPGIGPVVGAAMHGSGHLLGTLAHGATVGGLESWGAQIMAGLPSGLGIQTSAATLGNAITPVVSGAVGSVVNGVGQLGSGILIGGTAMNAMGMVGRNLADRTIGDLVVSAQSAIARTRIFLDQSWNKVQSLIQGATKMSQDYIPNDLGLEKAKGLSPETVTSIRDRSLQTTYLQLHEYKQELNGIYERASHEGFEYLKSIPRTLELERKLQEGIQRLEKLIDRAIERGVYQIQDATQETAIQDAMPEQQAAEVSSQDSMPKQQAVEVSPQNSMSEQQVSGVGPQDSMPKQQAVEVSPQNSMSEQSNPEVGPDLSQESVSEKPEFVSSVDLPSREAEDYALGLVNQLAQRRLNVERMQIDIDGHTIFKMHGAEIDQKRTSITDAQAEIIKTALNDPAAVQGTVTISQGSRVLLKVENGRVIKDDLGLIQEQTKVAIETPNSPLEGLYDKYANKTSPGLVGTKETAINAINGGHSLAEVSRMLENDPAVQKLQKQVGETEASRIVGDIVADASTQTRNTQGESQQEQVKASMGM